MKSDCILTYWNKSARQLETRKAFWEYTKHGNIVCEGWVFNRSGDCVNWHNKKGKNYLIAKITRAMSYHGIDRCRNIVVP